MSSDGTTTHREDPPPARPLSSLRRICVLPVNLRKGMFVAELDRPWSDTPFLIQGFTIDSAIELETLRRHCRHVFVDLERSSPESADLLRAIGPADAQAAGFADTVMHWRDTETGTSGAEEPCASDAPENAPENAPNDGPNGGTVGSTDGGPDGSTDGGPDRGTESPAAAEPPSATPAETPTDARRPSARTFQARADIGITRDTRRRFRALVGAERPEPAPADRSSKAGRAFDRLKRMFGAPPTGRDDRSGRALAALNRELQAMLAPDERLSRRGTRLALHDELPRARQALAHAEQALAGLLDAIRAGRPAKADRIAVAANHLSDSLADNPDALLRIAQLRDAPLLAHQQGVRSGIYMIALALRLGMPRRLMAQAGMVGMLADVGKASLPRALLEKPGMLNAAEYNLVKEHVRLGIGLLTASGPIPDEVVRGIAQHHERLDGSGYPAGLLRADIGLFGRMAAIADSYSALTMPRAYANPLAPQDALMSLYQWGDSSFDAVLVETFVQAIGVFPVGTLGELSSGEIALVCEQNEGHPLQPRVRILTWPDRRALPVEIDVDLLDPSDGPPRRMIRGLHVGAFELRPRDPDAGSAATQ